MFGRVTRQAIRNFATESTPKPLRYDRIGTNLPFNIHKVNALTVKFILFFSSAFYIPFFALHVQTDRYFQGHKITEKPKEFESVGIYGLTPDEQEKNAPEIFI